jgi:hypothetical protein
MNHLRVLLVSILLVLPIVSICDAQLWANNDDHEIGHQDLVGSARRGQKEVVQGERYHTGSASHQMSNRESVDMSYRTEASPTSSKSAFGDIYFVAVVAGCAVATIFGVMGTGYCLYRFQQYNKAAADVDYPAYGVVGPITKVADPSNGSISGSASKKTSPHSSGNVTPSAGHPGDRKLAQSAQMYHYQHQKQQMIQSANSRAAAAAAAASSTGGKAPRLTSTSDGDSDEEHDEMDYIVYECAGLAPTGEMEVKNPLFHDDSTPASPMKTPTTVKSNGKGEKSLK